MLTHAFGSIALSQIANKKTKKTETTTKNNQIGKVNVEKTKRILTLHLCANFGVEIPQGEKQANDYMLAKYID